MYSNEYVQILCNNKYVYNAKYAVYSVQCRSTIMYMISYMLFTYMVLTKIHITVIISFTYGIYGTKYEMMLHICALLITAQNLYIHILCTPVYMPPYK